MPSTCLHLNVDREKLLRNYGNVVRRVVFPATDFDNQVKTNYVRCPDCNRCSVVTCCCCLFCSTFGCIEHLRLHFEKSSHCLAISTEYGHTYCFQCNDFVYDRKLEKIRKEAENGFRRRLGLCLRNEWNPSSADSRILKNASRIYYLSRGTVRGLRGLVNLGNTCFMNCIIQTLAHIPSLRDYFLTDQHSCRYQFDGISDNDSNPCLMCEMSNIFQEFYNGQSEPFVPQRMLHLVWTHAQHLAGYEQHDAHEFFISTLDVLHRHSESTSVKVNPHDCKCIIDRLFTGRLQSDLTCMRCGRISTTVDPFWDISLELVAAGEIHSRSLQDCLASYVKCENLGASAKIKCETCGTYEAGTKQLSLKTLPMIACFHLKRFEHTATNRRQKIHNIVRFPEQIDLTPYMTSHCKDKSLRLDGADTASVLLNRTSNRYDLLAVVNHNGSTESGHYSCFVRHHLDQWYKCNDQSIHQEVLESVLASEGYLLFYTKTFIDYD